MKIRYFTSFALAVLIPMLLQGQEIEVPQTNHPLITKRTATWCPNCGSYGWTLFRDLLADQQSNALVVAAHFGSSALANEVSNELTTLLGGFGQPVFFLNKDNLGANSGNIATVRQDAAAAVAGINEIPPVAQTGLLAQVAGDSLIVQTKTHFFGDVGGEPVNLSVYLIEPTVIATQSGQGAMAEHKNILRHSMTGTAFGETIADGGAAAGAEVERRYSISTADLEAQGIDISNLGNSSLIIAAVLWQGNAGENFEVLNTNQVRESMLTSAPSLEAQAELRVFPIPAAAEVTLSLTLEEALPAARLSLMHANGQRLQTIQQGTLGAGEHTFVLNKGQWPAGTYWLQLTDGNRTLSRKVIFH
ncbi:MAG: T9SS type A sorting domain-containing protein [Phaeodactylibacter sp.]|uniref:T9SS type A sorting domain-containing protein n=1 Tax=Phaeodactylibacter sp. TaxID=1940289 RepID=UPI0032EEB9A1